MIAVLWMTFTGISFLFPITPKSDAAEMNYCIVVFGGVMILSLGWYYFPVYGGVHWFSGPIPNIAGYQGSGMQHRVSGRDSSDSSSKEKLDADEEIREVAYAS